MSMHREAIQINNWVNQNIKYLAEPPSVDRWQTPSETLGSGSGDCEDIAILKYFMMMDKGVSTFDLHLAYCFLNGYAHMVLLWLPNAHDTFVLDNVERRMLPLIERSDILVVYTFNHHGLFVSGGMARTRCKKFDQVLDNLRGQ